MFYFLARETAHDSLGRLDKIKRISRYFDNLDGVYAAFCSEATSCGVFGTIHPDLFERNEISNWTGKDCLVTIEKQK